MNPRVRGLLTGCASMATWTATRKGYVVTQGDASLAAPTQRNGSIPFRRNWAVAESPAALPGDDRTRWAERMGRTIEEALGLSGLTGRQVAAGAAGLGRVVR